MADLPSPNGKPPGSLNLAGRIDPARVLQLEQQTAIQAQLLVSRALSDANELSNTLHFLTEQARAGSTPARQSLTVLFQRLDDAKAAAAGLTVVRGAPPAGG